MGAEFHLKSIYTVAIHKQAVSESWTHRACYGSGKRVEPNIRILICHPLTQMLETKNVFGWLLINMNWKKPNKKQKKTVNHENILLFLLTIFELPPIKQPLLKKSY